MKKLLICLATTAAVCTAHAQTGNFTGFSAGANMTMNGASVTEKTSAGAEDSYGQQSLGIGGFAGYGLSIGNSSVLTFGIDYSFSDLKLSEFKTSTSSGSSKVNNLWSLSIAPGTMLTDNTLAYFKLGFENGNVLNSKSNLTDNAKNITGNSWGLGVKTLFNKSTYLQIEVKQTNFGTARFDNSTADFTVRGTSGSVGMGFMF